jgi:lysyl-tRNA synthetase class 2
VPKNNWQPTATIATLKKRAKILARIRQFFANRDVLEVETPLLSQTSVTDPYILSIPAFYDELSTTPEKCMFLQTSPEYAMKRLLAAGCGSIYQLCKAFRQGEQGKLHNPEFTMLEWYRINFDHHALMDEMDAFLQEILGTEKADRYSVAEIYLQYLQINPHTASIEELEHCAKHQNLLIEKNADVNFWLDLLFSHCIEPQLGLHKPVFLYDYPVSQASLAKIRSEDPPVASRFEVYFKGIELANGFHELNDEKEQRNRFIKNNKIRKEKNLTTIPLDENLLSALVSGLPNVSGVALGIDRLMMLAFECESIKEVLSFSFERA